MSLLESLHGSPGPDLWRYLVSVALILGAMGLLVYKASLTPALERLYRKMTGRSDCHGNTLRRT